MTDHLFRMKNSIVLVPFPFDDFSNSKIRPALCLTNEIGEFQHVIIAFISSNLASNILRSDFVIMSKLKTETGLKVDSVIKLNKIVTIPKGLIKRKLGELSVDDSITVGKKLIRLFEL